MEETRDENSCFVFSIRYDEDVVQNVGEGKVERPCAVEEERDDNSYSMFSIRHQEVYRYTVGAGRVMDGLGNMERLREVVGGEEGGYLQRRVVGETDGDARGGEAVGEVGGGKEEEGLEDDFEVGFVG